MRSKIGALAILVMASPLAEQEARLTTARGAAAADPTPLSNPLSPALVARAGPGPVVVVYRRTEVPLVAVRVAVPVNGESGAAAVLQELARERLEARVQRHGGRVRLSRTPGQAVYLVTGPAASYDALVSAMQEALRMPSTTQREVEAAAATVRAASLAELEAAEKMVRRRLQESLFPTLVPPAEESFSPSSLSRDALAGFWRRYYDPARMQTVIVGDVEPEPAARPWREWSARDGQGRGSITSAGVEPDPQVLFPWVGVGFPVRRGDPAAVAVTALILETRMQALGAGSATAEFWWAGDRQALVLIASSRGRSGAGRGGATRLRSELRSLPEQTATQLEEPEVAWARRTLRRSLLLAGRTAEGLADLAGTFLERTGDPAAAAAFLDRLDAVDLSAVRSVLENATRSSPVLVEVSP